ncbi:UDP-glucose 4-epimerase GalE [Campylobacter jejuni]|nr:UDP-glucose 4-epimerase GalE [Campylobacter jejuni]EAJ8980784.1 UDP-glucose 4-epimerase GalE [Campylobacter jejuni]EAJ9013871.1 UDP-glucose 4-epimerase GalE [Campylobacter jejuni]EAK4078033.1 UDP-glucose 4-epimerase GalE [Campylobacter jejuni]EFP5531159.1 UDP-glucose 4-epimerase GalE [Campylobacter jejuni]
MKNILVVGGAGYIGSHTLKHLLDNDYNCIVMDNLIYGHKQAIDKRAKFIHADLLDTFSLTNVFKQEKIDAVVHFAAFAYVGESVVNPAKYYQNNVIGTINLLNAMLENNIKDIVFSSTCATYGEPQYTPIDEKHPQNPINAYGRTKLMIEQVFADYEKAYGLRHISLRYFNAAGASNDGLIGESHEPETHLIPLVLKAIKGEIPAINIFGNDYDTEDGTCIRDYIHVEDLALAHRLALENLYKFSGCINLGTGIGTSVKEIISAAEIVSGKKCPINYTPRREGDPARLYADNKKAKEILSWEAKYTDIKDIIKSAWDWENNRKY